ncbi:uncharacterized protein [Chanodichthys erythropterus]|uniref:uncharacterized protein isoform X1 n=1 Tax=Chanodichthys erythropterus TaxID=933992 RepID=UPI00351E84F4
MLPGMFLVNMVRKKRIKPEQDAILSDKDKAFIEGRQINTFKGRGVLALEHIESSTFVVEDRGILSQSKHVEDVEGNYLFDFTWNGTRNCIDATKVDCSLGRLLNDDHRNPNCKVKTIIVDGRPHLCLFSIRDIFPDEEVTYNYGDSSWPWRLRELCDEPSVTVTECRVNPSSSVSEKELCDETSVTVTECSVNPSSSVSEKVSDRMFLNCLLLFDNVQGLRHFEIKITPSFTYPQAILGVYDFLMNIIAEILITTLTHPSFIMAVIGFSDYELNKVLSSTSIHH